MTFCIINPSCAFPVSRFGGCHSLLEQYSSTVCLNKRNKSNELHEPEEAAEIVYSPSQGQESTFQEKNPYPPGI